MAAAPLKVRFTRIPSVSVERAILPPAGIPYTGISNRRQNAIMSSWNCCAKSSAVPMRVRYVPSRTSDSIEAPDPLDSTVKEEPFVRDVAEQTSVPTLEGDLPGVRVFPTYDLDSVARQVTQGFRE